MAYQTGTATDAADLLDKLRLFAIANGFTVNNWGDRTSGVAPRKALQVTKGVLAGSFLSDSSPGQPAYDPGPYIGVYLHSAYTAGGGTENQPERSEVCNTNDLLGPYQAYHFFSDNGLPAQPYLYVVVETSAGTFKHFGIGRLDTIGVINTGLFGYSSRWYYSQSINRINDPNSTYHRVGLDSRGASTVERATVVRADCDGIVPRWFDDRTSTYGSRISGGVRNTTDPSATVSATKELLYAINAASASQATGRSILSPCLLAVDRVGSLQSLVGAPPGIRWVNLRYLDPGQTISLGSDTWKVFPVIRKNGDTGQVNSALYGYAYKVN